MTKISDSKPQTHKTDLPRPSEPFLVIVYGFVIRKNMSISEPFAQYLVPVLDSIKSLADHISQVALVARPSLLYSKNYTKAVQLEEGSFS